MKRLYILSSLLKKNNYSTTSMKTTQGYRFVENEYEAKGMYLEKIKADFPDYDITDILCMEIPPDEIAEAKSIQDEEARTKSEHENKQF